MPLPTFIGVGAPRSGSTWLDHLLRSHPQVHLPSGRKEIHYFDRFPERPVAWYAEFFSPTDNEAPQAIGEITPTYLYTENCAKRIRALGSVTTLLVILRNPVDRLYSSYKMHVENKGYQAPFHTFVAEHPEAVEQGHYSRYLTRFLEAFDREQIEVFILEEASREVETTKNLLAQALGIDAFLFPEGSGTQVIRPAQAPRRRMLYGVAAWITQQLRYRLGLDRWTDRMLTLAKRMGGERLFGQAREMAPMAPEDRYEVGRLYESEITRLEQLLDIDLTLWKQSNTPCT
jgi:hypothetical protein